MNWKPLDTIGETGSEGGIILRDEASEECRITLEQLPDRCAVTCGFAGAFCHTAFCGFAEKDTFYETMKSELAAFAETETTPEQAIQFYEEFAAKY